MRKPSESKHVSPKVILLMVLFLFTGMYRDYCYSCPPPPPYSPSSLIATSYSSSRIDLSWSNVSDEYGYCIERSPNGSNSWMAIGYTNADVTSFQDTYSLSEATRYYYRVYAYNWGGASGYSNVANNYTRPATPTGINSIVRTSHRIDLSWVDNSSGETGYKILKSTDGIDYSQMVTLPANQQIYSIKQLEPSIMYYFKVVAYNTGGDSNYSNYTSNSTTDMAGFSETWDQITYPIYPGNSYQAGYHGAVTGSDQTWSWSTANDAVTSCGFNSCIAAGRFSNGASFGNYTLLSSDASYNLNAESNAVNIVFEADFDNLGSNDDRGLKIEICNETNYLGGSAIVIQMNSKTDEPALSVHSSNQGTQSNSIETTSSMTNYGGASSYWVSTTFTNNGTNLNVQYEIFNKNAPATVIASGSGTLNQVPGVDLNLILVTFGQNAIGSIDDIEISGDETSSSYSSSSFYYNDESLLSLLYGDEYEHGDISEGYYRNPLMIRQNPDDPLIGLEKNFPRFAEGFEPSEYMYHDPSEGGYLYWDYLSDPFVIKFMGKYYMYTTCSNVRAFVSEDLINWTATKYYYQEMFINYVFDEDTQTTISTGWDSHFIGEIPDCEWMQYRPEWRGMAWGPVIFYDNGIFYMYVAYKDYNKCDHVALFTGNQPYGNFTRDYTINFPYGMLLGNIFVEDDAQMYACYNGTGGMHYGRMNSIYTLDSSSLHQLVNTAFVADTYRHNNDGNDYNYVEGPGMFKVGGRYHFVYSGNTYYYPSNEVRTINADSIANLDASAMFPLMKNDNITSDSYDGNTYTGPSAGSTFVGPDLMTNYILSSVMVNCTPDANGNYPPGPAKVLMLDKVQFSASGHLQVIDNDQPITYGPTTNPQPLPRMPDWWDRMDTDTTCTGWDNIGNGSWERFTDQIPSGFTFYAFEGQSTGMAGLTQKISTPTALGNCTYEFNLRLQSFGADLNPKRFGCVISYDASTTSGIYVMINRVSSTSAAIDVTEIYNGETFQTVSTTIPRGNLPPLDLGSTTSRTAWHTLRIVKAGYMMSVYFDYIHIGDYEIRNYHGGHLGFVVENCDALFSYTAFSNHSIQNGTKKWMLYR